MWCPYRLYRQHERIRAFPEDSRAHSATRIFSGALNSSRISEANVYILPDVYKRQVASSAEQFTAAFSAQLAVVYLLALRFSKAVGLLPEEREKELTDVYKRQGFIS